MVALLERELQKNHGAERSAERKVAERERSVERGYRNSLERGAVLSRLTLRSAHTLWCNCKHAS